MRTIDVTDVTYWLIQAQHKRQLKRGTTTMRFRQWCAYLLTMVVRDCRVCGCTENDACDEGCSWVEYDLCSACAPASRDKTATGVEGARA